MDTREFNSKLKRIKYDAEAFDELYQYYARRIVFHLSATYGRELAEDVSHEFFIKLISGKIDYTYIEKPTIWVYKCCENLAKTKIRLDSKYEPLYDNVDYKEQFYESIEVKIGIDKLDQLSKKIIFMYYWEGYNLEEISEILKIKYATVRKRHSRAIAKLKKILK